MNLSFDTRKCINYEIEQPFCPDAPLSLVSKDLNPIEVILLLLL